MPVNAVIVPLIDAAPALLANGNDDATGAAAAAPASDGTLRRIISLVTGSIFTTMPILPGDGGAGAFIRGLGRGSERTRSGKQVRLAVHRYNDNSTAAILTGSFRVLGVDLPDSLSGKPQGNAFAAAPSETSLVFSNAAVVNVGGSTTFDASSLSTDAFDADSKGYNWLVVANGQIIPYSTGALANNLSWSITSGVVTLRAGSSATTLPARSDIVVYKLPNADVTEIMAAGTHPIEDVRVTAKQVMWTRWTTNQLATTRTLVTLHHTAE